LKIGFGLTHWFLPMDIGYKIIADASATATASGDQPNTNIDEPVPLQHGHSMKIFYRFTEEGRDRGVENAILPRPLRLERVNLELDVEASGADLIPPKKSSDADASLLALESKADAPQGVEWTSAAVIIREGRG